MRRIYLIHGWRGNSNSEAWFSWMKKECKKRNIELVIPDMPNEIFNFVKSKSPFVLLRTKVRSLLGLLDARSVPRTKVRGLSNTSTSGDFVK